MKVEIKKLTKYICEYSLTRKDLPVELITLETKTYLVHDVCHYVVEKNLVYSKGFWGMLAQGYSFNQLFGKDNMLTTELRFIEQIVGPVQSVYLGNIQKQNLNEFVQHIGFTMTEAVLEGCLAEITSIIKSWEELPVGGRITLVWD